MDENKEFKTEPAGEAEEMKTAESAGTTQEQYSLK